MPKFTFEDMKKSLPNVATSCLVAAGKLTGKADAEEYIYTVACNHIYVKTGPDGKPFVQYGDRKITL